MKPKSNRASLTLYSPLLASVAGPNYTAAVQDLCGRCGRAPLPGTWGSTFRVGVGCRQCNPRIRATSRVGFLALSRPSIIQYFSGVIFLQFRHYSAAPSLFCSSVIILQFRHYSAVPSLFCSSVIFLQFRHHSAVPSSPRLYHPLRETTLDE